MAGHGGAGKVYFILYLAVLLELLIIIVERDDAEEALKREKEALERKNKRIQLIAETIINALRGSQTSVSSTSDQTMTLGDPKEPDREFSVKVRVSDPAKDSVNDLSLTILRNESKMDSIEMTNDTSLFPRVQMGQDYVFKYKFKPTFGEGTYKLRFNARTNQIVGVAQAHSADDTVKIGAVRLTVSELEDVEKGITENVTLKGFIDSLLTGNYSNFSTNLGANEFVVNVKRPEAKVTDQLEVFPQTADFIAFPGLQLPNPVKIQGADIKGVSISKVGPGPGDFQKVDTSWSWVYTPLSSDVGQNYTVQFKGQTNRGGGAKDIGNGSFSVSVHALQPVAGDSAVYTPTDQDDAGKNFIYSKIPLAINAKYLDLNGHYQILLTLDGAPLKTFNEPTAEFTPTFMEMEGKTLGVTVNFRTDYMKDYIQLRHDNLPIKLPPLHAKVDGPAVTPDIKIVRIIAGYGIPGQYSEVGGDLDVQSDGGAFETKATKSGAEFGYILRVVKFPQNVPAKGKEISVTLTDHTTGGSTKMAVLFMPAKRAFGH
ncbi:MAG TPA: hypothetical protein VEW28_06960 [Candidatus Kapabacteria bacterium]|nr:hypothetical protein [Candidatus Kapabacteria bacterium]